jgi:hypothetical protein
MDMLHYNMGDTILTINYPIDESGHYCIETEDEKELGHLFIDGIHQDTGSPIWKGTTEEVNLIAEELGDFIEQSDL